MPHSTGLWRHRTLKTTFALCIDDFGVKYFSKIDADHLINALQKNYNITTNWIGSLYCGLTLNCNYKEGWVDIHIPGYVIRALTKFNHPTPHKPQHAPTPVYNQHTGPDDNNLQQSNHHHYYLKKKKQNYYKAYQASSSTTAAVSTHAYSPLSTRSPQNKSNQQQTHQKNMTC